MFCLYLTGFDFKTLNYALIERFQNRNQTRLPWNFQICSSLVVEHESCVPVCFGKRQWVILKPLFSDIPNIIPIVSMFLLLFDADKDKNFLEIECGTETFCNFELVATC